MENDKKKDEKAQQGADVTLGLLNAVAAGGNYTQRSLAARLGTALGLTNALLKRAARKGLIKISQAPARRYAYYITPEGFREKSRLVGQYLNTSLYFFRIARTEYTEACVYCLNRDWNRIALAGVGELADIASISARISDVVLVGIIDESSNVKMHCGLPVFASLADIGQVDAIIVTNSDAPQNTFDLLARDFPADAILTPEILHVSRSGLIIDGGAEE